MRPPNFFGDSEGRRRSRGLAGIAVAPYGRDRIRALSGEADWEGLIRFGRDG